MAQVANKARNINIDKENLHSLKTPDLNLIQTDRTKQKQIAALETVNWELRRLLVSNGRPETFLGNSGVMQDLYKTIIQYASQWNHILIHGEPGTETDLVAQTLSKFSNINEQQFIHIGSNSYKLAAQNDYSFNFQFKNRPIKELLKQSDIPLTLYFENIYTTDIHIIKEVLQSLNYKNANIKNCKVRIIGAIQNFSDVAIKLKGAGKKLFDILYDNLIVIPPLRTRGADILLLADHFVKKYSLLYKKQLKYFSPAATEFLLSYHWPGNITEIEMTIENIVKRSQQKLLTTYDFCIVLNEKHSKNHYCINTPFDELISLYEKEMIINTLKCTKGNQSRAANLLKITKRILQYKIDKYAVDCKKYKTSCSVIRKAIKL